MDIDIIELRKKYALSDEEFDRTANEVFGQLSVSSANSSKSEHTEDKPKFILIGGQAGSGKTSLVIKKNLELNNTSIIIDQDELRSSHPQHSKIVAEHTDREEFLALNLYIADLIKSIVNKARKSHFNVILETALQDVEAFVGYLEEFKNDGYSTELAVMSVPEAEANLSMLYRYCYYLEKDGSCRRNTRINPNAPAKIRANLQKLDDLDLLDDIQVYIRNSNSNELPVQIFSQRDATSETPVQALDRGVKLSLSHSLTAFNERFNYIHTILTDHGDTQRLETLMKIKEQFSSLDERE